MPTTPVSPADPRSYVGLALQSVKGTGVVPVKFPRYVGAVAMSHAPAIRDIRDGGGGDVIARTNKDFVSPSVRFAEPARPDSVGWASAWFLGADAISGAGDPYTHTITKDSTPRWLSAELNYADEDIERIVDGQIVELTWDFRKRSSGPEIMLSGVLAGLDSIRQVSPTAIVRETERPYIRSDCAWTIDGVAIASDDSKVESAVVTMRWTADEQMLGDTLQRASLMKLHLEVNIELVQLFASSSALDAYRATHYGTPAGTVYDESVYSGSFQVTVNQAEAPLSRQFDITCPVVEWTDAVKTDLNPDASEATRLTRTGKMLFNSGGEPVTIAVDNDVAAAYVT